MRRGSAGFALLEAGIAAAIVSLAAVATLATFGAEVRTGIRARDALRAAALAEGRLATVRLLPTEDLELLPDSVRQGRFAPPFDEYRWDAFTRTVPDHEGLMDVSVRVEWSEGAYSLRTRLFRPPPRTP
ncbi:MAG: hypothetical protein ACREKI_00650 [Gemmatimonadota bacterium]